MPEFEKKTRDREYFPEEVIAIEDKLDVRGKVVSGVMRGSGVRRGAEPDISVGDHFPMQTKFGKIYKIWVYRGTPDMYATACIPEAAARIDAYFEYRMRFGEVCKQFGKVDHFHEYRDGDEEIIKKWFKADERHLDPDAPLIREDFDRKDSLAAKHPRKISYQQISDLVRSAAIAAGIRKVNKGEPYKRHKVMNTHGFRKLFKKRCRQAKVDPIIIERLMGHESSNPRDGVSKLMMCYDPEDWAEMQSEFQKAIPNLTITKDAIIQAELEKTKEQLRNVPSMERLQAQQQSMQEQLERYERRYEQLTARAMDLLGPRLKELKKEKKRSGGDLKKYQEELNAITISGPAVIAEMDEDERQEEEGARRAAAVRVDDPLENNIDYLMEQEMMEMMMGEEAQVED